MPQTNWKRGTEKHLTTYHHQNDPDTITVLCRAKDANNEDVLLKREFTQEDFCRKFMEDENVQVIQTAPLEITESRRRAAVA